MGQNRLIVSYSAQIRRILENGGYVYFILIDPDSNTMETVHKRATVIQSLPLVRQEHRGAIERLISITKSIDCKGKLVIKLIDNFAPYTIYGFDINDPQNAKLYV